MTTATVRYLVKDVDVSIAFYKSLGFALVERWGLPFAIMELHGLRLWLSGPQTSAARPLPDGRTPEPGGWNRIVILVSDIEAVANVLQERGTTFLGEPITGPGGTQILLQDPDQNPIELFSPKSE